MKNKRVEFVGVVAVELGASFSELAESVTREKDLTAAEQVEVVANACARCMTRTAGLVYAPDMENAATLNGIEAGILSMLASASRTWLEGCEEAQ